MPTAKRKKVHKKKVLNTEKLTKVQKRTKMLQIFLQGEVDKSVAARYKSVSEEFKCDLSTVYRAAKRDNWIIELEAKLSNQERDEAEKQVMEHAGIKEDIPMNMLVAEIKQFSWEAIRTASDLLSLGKNMIGYYTVLINSRIKACGTVAALTPEDLRDLDKWNRELRYYQTSITDFIRPGSIAALLKMVGIEAHANAEGGLDKEQVTPARLLELLQNNGMVSVFDHPVLVYDAFKEVDEQLPDIDGSR